MTLPISGDTMLADVSRETRERLDLYETLLRKWQKRINIVSPKTIDDLRTRHFLDSAQLMHAAPEDARKWVDLGSGGGFPGLVCAILDAGQGAQREFVLIESDARKCGFMREVIRQTDISAQVLTERIETAQKQSADIVSARALAPLDRLLPLAQRHLGPQGTCLFLKGANHQAELASVAAHWQMSVDLIPSATSDQSVILSIRNLEHV